jgi:hypothetical protein
MAAQKFRNANRDIVSSAPLREIMRLPLYVTLANSTHRIGIAAVPTDAVHPLHLVDLELIAGVSTLKWTHSPTTEIAPNIDRQITTPSPAFAKARESLFSGHAEIRAFAQS